MLPEAPFVDVLGSFNFSQFEILEFWIKLIMRTQKANHLEIFGRKETST